MTRFECRRAVHDGHRYLHNLEDHNAFTVVALSRILDELTAAYSG